MTTSVWQPVRRHPVASVVERLHAELDAHLDSTVWSMSHEEFIDTLASATRLVARMRELQLRVAAGAERRDIGAHVGATSTASWWAHTSQATRAAAHRSIRLARDLDTRHERVRDAMAAGDLLEEQARVIVDAVDALPADLLDPELIDRAEAHLIGLAGEHDAKTLKTLGRTILDTLAPDVAEAHEQRVLDEEEAKAHQTARLTLTDDGHGRTHGRFTLPTAQAEIFRKHLLAIAAPKHQAATGNPAGAFAAEATAGLAPGERLPLPQRLGHAFMEYIERYPADQVPDAGGVSATVVITMPLDTLMGGLKAAQLDTGATITAAQARRMACEAGIIPVVLDGQSQVLDLGRTKRFHNKAQRIAMAHRDRGCTAQGCDWPPGLCHAHHDPPWATGNGTNVRDARLLCPHHHTRAHDPTYEMARLPGGKVAFTRRT